MSNCDSCASKGTCNSEGSCSKETFKYGNAKNIIGVISGKGGVGKSTITGVLATKLREEGYKVGVLDGDITGPSMPRFFGISDKRATIIPTGENEEVKIIPVETKTGIKVMSLNLLTEQEEAPVIWRGPVITGVLTQMYTDTEWGELDYLLIDMPPGTGDIALTVMQSLPVTKMVVVSTPQDMVSMIVKKVVIMIEKMGIEVLGVVENMSYIKCGSCGEKLNVFSKKSAEEQAEYLNIPLIADMPINLDLSEEMEKGEVETFIINNEEYAQLYNNFKNLYK
ncbi:Mrp/NBP35 family ATP-binding protein [Clostridium botulinum]|uniref:Iron-sulfur cluster carrier protein n=1 Tax=Clostridium botulinum TaxID=1491 RepID=A0A6B4ZIX4_CLOBO|nr:Mrp/NBP35 family ATP-binding protein [Clostridium botulinum]KRU24850.1 sodium:proton antiporter [Clostridium sporogenes]KRU31746.1 sodium:proton antiporter [Clostridium sporogenes]KRU34011.1 sodium:proton antiporter [Clostridium sporogenes]KRU41028.1 sodium:proton antiporter [Clostridium sporogenes]MBZ1328379.1 Mrp/NBP35 family ATP-binding protein [Clostridium botulinum]